MRMLDSFHDLSFFVTHVPLNFRSTAALAFALEYAALARETVESELAGMGTNQGEESLRGSSLNLVVEFEKGKADARPVS